MHIYIDDNNRPLKEFQLPADFRPELSRTNTFLTNEGSQSIPLTLPASDHNLKIIGYSHRATSSKRPVFKMPVILHDNAAWIRGSIYISQIHKLDGIECTIYTNEGQLYEKIKDYKLRDLNWPKQTGQGADYAAKAKDLMGKFEIIMNNHASYPNPDYYIFSVTTDYVFLPIEYNDTQHADYYTLVLNEYEGSIPKLKATTTRKYQSETGNEATIYEVPVGYGVTPFLRISYILRHMFEYFGYKLEENIFDTNDSMKRLCLLNNTADAIVSGVLDYSQLMPQSLTVDDFINNIRKKFSIEFIESNGKISIKTWNEVLSMSPDMDLSKYTRNHLSWLTEEKGSIQIEYESTYQIDIPEIAKSLKHNANEGMSIEDLSTKDKVPFFKKAFYNTEGLTTDAILSLYIGGISHLNSDLILAGNTEPEKEDSEDSGIIICFSNPAIQLIWGNDYCYQGTIYPPIINGSDNFTLLASEYNKIPGIYERFYRDRDRMLEKANQQVIYEAIIPSHVIDQMDISVPKIINGQKVLIERIDYIFGKTDLCQITARTLHLYPEE